MAFSTTTSGLGLANALYGQQHDHQEQLQQPQPQQANSVEGMFAQIMNAVSKSVSCISLHAPRRMRLRSWTVAATPRGGGKASRLPLRRN